MSTLTSKDGVFELCLDQPPCNEIGLDMLEVLEHCADEVERSDAKALLIYSTRPLGFSAGADLRGLYAGMEQKSPEAYIPELRAYIDRIHAVANRLDSLPQATFAALHGVCFGGGFELALVCDVLIADRTTRFAFPELRLGIIPAFGGIPRLRREVPNAVVRDLILTGRSLNAARAHELGLVSQLVAPGAALTAARAAARQAAQYASETRAAAKAFMKPVPLEELAREKELFMQLVAQPRVRAALAEFVSRTDPLPYLTRSAAAQEQQP